MSDSGVALRFEETLAEPARCWIRWAPRAWPGPRAEFLDLARGELAGKRLRAAPPTGKVAIERLDDTVYLPPAREAAQSWRRELCRSLLSGGVPVLEQLRPGEEPVAGAAAVFDLTEIALRCEWDRLARLPDGAAVVWPLIGGLTDRPAGWRPGLEALAAAGARVALPTVPVLSSAERRRLSTLGDETAFDALFHGPPPSRLGFARAAAGFGLRPFPARQPGRPLGRVGRNRELAGRLALAGELLLLLEHAEGRAQSFFRAARRIETDVPDFGALAREGNLAIVEWLEPEVRREIVRHTSGSETGLVEELLAELHSDPDGFAIRP